MLYGLGFVVLEVVTMFGSFSIEKRQIQKVFLNSLDEGYRTLEYSKNQEIILRLDAEDKLYSKKHPQGLDILLYFIPGVNLVSSYIIGRKKMKLISENKGYKKELVLMNDEERQEVSKLTSRKEKVNFFRKKELEELKEIRDDIISSKNINNKEKQKVLKK